MSFTLPQGYQTPRTSEGYGYDGSTSTRCSFPLQHSQSHAILLQNAGSPPLWPGNQGQLGSHWGWFIKHKTWDLSLPLRPIRRDSSSASWSWTLIEPTHAVCVSTYDTGARSLLRTPAMLLFCLPTHVINNSSNKSLIPRTVSLSGPLTFQTPNLSDKFNTNQAMYIRRNKRDPASSYVKGDLLNVMFWPQPMDGASTDVCMCFNTHTPQIN